MAKVGIESFLLDCHTNDNMAEIEAAYGIKGFAVIVKLWQKIYSDKGYYCEWIERSPLLFLSQWFGGNSGVDLSLINQVVSHAIKIGIFNESMFNEYAILTSERIQRQYFDVVKRRTEIEVIDEYLLVSVANFKGNVNIIEKNVCRNSTSKVNTYFDSKKVNDAFAAYLAMRERSAPVPGSKIVNLIEQLNTFKDKGCSDDELVEIVKEATSKGWMNFYKSDKKKPEQSKANFTERNYSKDDMESLERKLLTRR